jgi:hypothetical protein
MSPRQRSPAPRNPDVGSRSPELSWDFEAYRAFLPFAVMQQAANVLHRFEGVRTDDDVAMGRLTAMLVERTGRGSWEPQRRVGEIAYSEEGGVFRNKARMLGSFFICVPPELHRAAGLPPTIELLDFGRRLALGQIRHRDYYDFIIARFHYPHPVFTSYETWDSSGRTFWPLVFLLQILRELYRSNPAEAYLERSEVVHELMSVSDNGLAADAARSLLERRAAHHSYPRLPPSDIRTRKVGDMMGFLAISGYALYLSDQRAGLNVHDVHPVEGTHFLESRQAGGVHADRLGDIDRLIDSRNREG